MECKTLTNGFSLPVLGLGTAHVGGGRKPDHKEDNAAIEALERAIALGYSHIDTAELYGGGHSEELIAAAIAATDRAKLIISTKVFKNHLRGWRLRRAAKRSLKRLGLSYVDLYSIHAPNPAIPLKSTMHALDELVAEGLVRHIGVSNFTVSQLEEAQALTKNKIVTNQIEYNLAVREQSHFEGLRHMESEILPYCQSNDILVVATCPIARGLLLHENEIMRRVSAKYQKSPAQIALNWLISQKNVVAIAKSTDEKHLRENLGATGWHMESEDIELLRNKYPSDKS